MAVLSQLSLTPLMDEEGVPIVGAYLRFYEAGTSTPKTVYRDGLLSSPYDHDDIRTNGAGRIPTIWVAGNPYRVRMTTSRGTLIEDIDDIPADTESGPAPAPDTAVETGDMIASYRTGPRAGWVRINGRTIGSVASGATERANADCEDLFVHLWEADATLAVSGGRGANAASDWAANKTIALPNGSLRALVGLDGMGGTATGLFDDVTFASGDAATLGSRGGAATLGLTVDQLPEHTVTGTTAADGAHSHTGTAASSGSHTHTATTGSAGAHNHDIPGTVAFIGGAAGGPGLIDSTTTTTSTDGAHTHTVSVTAAGAHTHSVTTNTVTAHTHTFESDEIGAGDPVETAPPFLLVTIYIKL